MQPRGSTWSLLNSQDPVWNLILQCCKLSQPLLISQVRYIRYFVIVKQSLLIKGNTFLLPFTRLISKAEKCTPLFYLGFTWHRSIQRWRSQNKTMCFFYQDQWRKGSSAEVWLSKGGMIWCSQTGDTHQGVCSDSSWSHCVFNYLCIVGNFYNKHFQKAFLFYLNLVFLRHNYYFTLNQRPSTSHHTLMLSQWLQQFRTCFRVCSKWNSQHYIIWFTWRKLNFLPLLSL
jgi:hypothetical protein